MNHQKYWSKNNKIQNPDRVSKKIQVLMCETLILLNLFIKGKSMNIHYYSNTEVKNIYICVCIEREN